MCDTKDTIDPAANFPPAVEELFNFSEMEKKSYVLQKYNGETAIGYTFPFHKGEMRKKKEITGLK